MKKQSNLSRLLTYAGNYRLLSYLSWILAAASAWLALVPFWYIWQILHDVILAAPDYGKAVHITDYGWMAVAYAVGAMLVYIAGLMCAHLSAFRIAANLRIALVEKVTKLPLGQIEQFGSGKLRRIILETAGSAETYLAHQLPDKARAMATAAGLLLLLFFFDWKLGILCILPIGLGFLIMSCCMAGPQLQKKMGEYQNALADMSNEAVEYIRGIPVVKTFGQSVFSFKKFKAAIDNYEKWTISYTKELRGPMMAYTLAVNSVFVFLIAGAFLFWKGAGDYVTLLNLLFYMIITPVISLTLSKIMLMGENGMLVQDTLDRIDGVLNLQPLEESEKPQHPSDHSIDLRHVSFSYDGSKQAVKDISLHIGSGQTVAFVGPSGGGKTTLANLIARFFDVQNGSIEIGGADVRKINKAELMNTISFVFQNSRMMKASIFENVRLGRPGATKQEVLEALEAAHCMDIIEKFPEGVHTVIGSKGVYLSGGEMQRIAIARALLKDAPIIILDEATAFADPDNETKVQAAFQELAKNRTVILIAHRLSTITGADQIFVLCDGSLAEQGTFETLRNADGLFAKMWQEYQKSVQWKVEKEV